MNVGGYRIAYATKCGVPTELFVLTGSGVGMKVHYRCKT